MFNERTCKGWSHGQLLQHIAELRRGAHFWAAQRLAIEDDNILAVGGEIPLTPVSLGQIQPLLPSLQAHWMVLIMHAM